MKDKRIGTAVYAALFLSMMLVPLLKTNTVEGDVSVIDNRKLVDAPVFGSTGYTAASENYLHDRIGFRREMVNGYAIINDLLAGELTHPLYTYGRDGYVFFNMHNTVQYDEFHKTFAEMVLKMQEYCEGRGAKFYFMFNPEKTSVLREYLPDGVNYDDSWVDQMLSYMDELGVRYVNSTPVLREKSQTEQVFNVKYDAGHWNDLGCFYATNEVLKRMHEDFPEVSELTLEEYQNSETIARKLPVSDFVVNETVPSFKLISGYDDISGEYQKYVSLNPQYSHFHYLLNKAENADKLPETLIFQGSYYNRGPQFFAARTSKDIGIHNYQNVLNLDEYFNLFQPQAVIFEAAEYTFTNQYFNLEGMKAIDWNPALFKAETDLPFEMQCSRLLSETEEHHTDEKLYYSENTQFDDINIFRMFSDAEYMYLITDHSVYDLQNGEEGIFVRIPHGELESGSAVVYVEEMNGERFFCRMKAEKIPSVEQYALSENTQEADGTFVLRTDVEGNRFNAAVLQILDGGTGEYLDMVKNITHVGNAEGAYRSHFAEGWYILRLKANSNKQDEYIDTRVYLKTGDSLMYHYAVDLLSGGEVIISDYRMAISEKGNSK